MKFPRPSRVCIFEKTPSIRRMSLYRSSVCCSIITRVELVGAPGPNSVTGHRVGGPKISAKLLLHILNNAESNAELKGLEVDSLVLEPIQVHKAPKMCRRTYRAHGQVNP